MNKNGQQQKENRRSNPAAEEAKKLTSEEMAKILTRDLNAAVTTFHLILTSPELMKLFSERVLAQVKENIAMAEQEGERGVYDPEEQFNSAN